MLLKPRYKDVKHPVQQPSCSLQGCLGSNGVDPQLEFTSVTSTDLPHWAPTEALCPHMLHQSGCRLFWNYRNQCIKWSETYHKELRLHLGCWPGPLYHGYPDQANPSDAVQKMLGHSDRSLLAHDCCRSTAPLLLQSCSPVFSTNTTLMFLGNGAHEISKAFWNSVWQGHTYFTCYKSVKYKCLFFWEITFGLTHIISHVGDSL